MKKIKTGFLEMCKIILITIIVLLPELLKGQQLSIKAATFAADQDIVSFVDMTQDSRGLIWIASNNNGLFNYDGIRLTSFKSETNNIGNTQVSRLECVLADSKDNIWIGTFQEGLQHFDPETESFTSYTHSNNDNSSICSDSVRAILEDEDGFLWIGTVKGLDKFDVNTGKFTHFTGSSEDAKLLARKHVRTIYKDKSGILWISCGSPFFDDQDDPTMGGLYRLDKKSGEVIRYKHIENDSTSLTDNRVRTVFEDSRGVFWVGTSGDGLHIMDREKGTFTRLHHDPKNPKKPSRPAINNSYNYVDDHITFINEDAAGFVWIGTFSGGLNRYNPQLKTVQHYGTNEPEPFKLERNDFWCSLLTRDNLFWIPGWVPQNNNQILYKVSTTINQLNHTKMEDWATSFFEEENGTLWIGGINEIIRKSRDGEFNSYPLIRPETDNCFVISIEADEKNNLWLSTSRGLLYFNTTTKDCTEIKYYENIKSNERTDTVAITTLLNNDGTIWVGTTIGLILMDLKTGKLKHYYNVTSEPASLSNNIVGVLYKDKEGKLWVGTNMGLNLFNPSTESFNVKIGRQANINCIYKDKSGNLWVGTANVGLYLFDPQSQTFTQFNDSTHILANSKTIFGISEDHENSLWINSTKGFIRLNTKTKVAELFGKSWNVQPEITANKVYTIKSGEILVGSQNGYYNFLPKNLNNNTSTPNPFISKMFIGGKQIIPGVDELLQEPLSSTKEITIAYNQNNFALEFDCIDFITDPLEKNLLFKLVNYDNVWRQKSGEAKTYYYNVPPGKYVFKVKAVNLYGVWGEKSIIINITPPWYKTGLAYGIFAVLLFLAIYLTHKFQRERVIKSERKKVMEKELAQAREIEKAYTELKATQSQLIQSEKMASLGELTAGIAHEIQNPLNFVNNFSEVNSELIDELEAEVKNGNIDDVLAIAKDIKENEQKINHHGKRADSIVKGMLQHSRTSNGTKEPTDINALADEYLRLSYHGLRAKDKSFNADFKTDLDPNLPKINVIPQDIGMVLLNLINNAFYAVQVETQNSASLKQTPQKQPNYKPVVMVSTKNMGTHVEIRVKDNGPGIPPHIVDKIFQPFFTTKPTGQGTGLGLSLSYDIVKAHGGSLTVNSTDCEARPDDPVGRGTEFIIQIPID